MCQSASKLFIKEKASSPFYAYVKIVKLYTLQPAEICSGSSSLDPSAVMIVMIASPRRLSFAIKFSPFTHLELSKNE